MLKLIGAGLGRTGTNSLKLALEQLLGAPCYHMFEVIENHRDHMPIWKSASEGTLPDWDQLFDGYSAAVDWPVAAFWEDLIEAYPSAPVLLSHRDADSWFASATKTIFPAMRGADGEFREMVEALFEHKFTRDFDNRDRCVELYEAHNARVREIVPPDRLFEWRPGDDWGPVCAALGMDVPSDAYPHTNSSTDFNESVDPKEL